MSKKSPTHASAALPPDVKPSLEANEILIKKFLKSCKKEDLQKTVFDVSAGVRRFQTKSQRERDERRRAKEKAIREYKEAENMAKDDKKRK
jgi:hypothetical protein